MLIYYHYPKGSSINDVTPKGEGGGHKNGNLGWFSRHNWDDKEREWGLKIGKLGWRHLWMTLKNSPISNFWYHSPSDPIATQAAIIVCAIYHFKSTISVFLSNGEDFAKIFNPEKLTRNKVMNIHGVLSVACVLVYFNVWINSD